MRKFVILAALAGALSLAACNKPEDEAPVNNAVENVVEEPPVENIAEPEAPATNAVNAAAPAPKISQDQQMLDDADATGLTARIPENGSAPQQAE